MSADGKAAAATTAGASAGSGAGGAVAASGGSVGIDVAPAAAAAGAGAAGAAAGQSKQPESAAALIVAGGGSLTGPKKKPHIGDGKDAAEAKITVSADGKTKTVVFSHPPDAQHKLDSRAWPLMVEGDKKLNACCGRDPPGARDCYDKAAGQFKLDEEWEEAAAAYIKAAEVAETITDLEGLEAGRFYEQAAKCMRTSSSRNALQILEYAKKVYEDKVSTQSMAKVWETMGEIYEKDLKEYAKAMDAYERAADNLMAQDTFAKANAVLLKVATIAASRYDFKRAIAIYERIAKKCLEPSGKYISEGVQVVRHLYHAMICQLVMAARAGDIAPANVALAQYRAMGQFERSEEFKFCSDLVRAFETNDAQLFTDTCYKYDKTHPLDQWSSTLLLECKQILKGVKAGNLDSIQLDLQAGAGGAGGAADPDLQ